ncbi:MAG: sugar transporter permease [Firmicutes bacterium]|nr:sugar transporter permease [Bacillota bacterium]
MKKASVSQVASWILALAALAVVLFPLYWMVNTSLKPASEVFQSPPTFYSSRWTLEPYRHMWATRPFGRYFFNSLVVSGGSTLLAMALSSLAAYGFSRFHMRWERAGILVLLLTQMLPGTLLIIPYFQFMARLGLINSYLALILAYVSFALPFSTWMLIGFFRSIPRELDEAAMMDGCGRIESFWRVILPLSLPGLVAVATFTFLQSWNSYVFALVLTTDPSMFPLPVGIANIMGEYQVQWNELMAASVLATLPVMVLYGFLERYLVAGITAGAVKG